MLNKFLIVGLVILLWVIFYIRGGEARAQSQSRSGSPTAAARARSSIRVYVTSSEKGMAEQKSASWNTAAKSSEGDTITIDGTKKYQDVLGFGGAFTDAACFMINELSADAREKLLKELFAPDQLGLNVCRVCMGASDYATHLYSYNDGEADPELKNFSIAHDKKYILPILKESREISPDLFLFASPWSPPGWMKAGGSMLGGSMRQSFMPSYAQYFVKFLKSYDEAGVPIQAVTVQNEVDTDQDGRMPACSWPQEYEVGFIANHLGPAIEKNGMKTKIWFIDHNYNLWGRAVSSLEDANFRKYAGGVAWHGYVGDAYKMSTVHDAFPDVPMYWTEGGPDITDPNYALDWTKWGKSFTSSMRNWCEAITAWNLALDEEGKPNIGPFPCGGVVTIDKRTKAIRKSGQYWALAHFSKFVKRGAKRIDSQSTAEGVEHVAFENKDGNRVIVITNSGGARTVAVNDGDARIDVALEPNSLTTLVWN